MKTIATIKGHPIHPMLIPFPIAFLSGALACDAWGWLRGSDAWWNFGATLSLAGILTALVAAIPGFIDYLFAVPPDSSAKKRATYHMTVNLSAVALFTIAWFTRGQDNAQSVVIVLIELAAVALMTMGGWLGGTLVYRNFVGPEHRYANKGKWQEQRVEAEPGKPVTVARADDLQVDQMKLLHVGDKRVVVARTAEGFVAFDDHCTHRGGSLAGGVMMCGKVQCLWHGSQFDVHTGQVKSGPAERPIATYRVEERDGEVKLIL